MNKLHPILLIALILLSGCMEQSVQQPYHPPDFTIDYTEDQEEQMLRYYVKFVPSLEWISQNTPNNTIFLNWWDYGHLINVISHRNVIAYAPSKKILNTVSQYSQLSEDELSKIECTDCTPHEKIVDIATALTTSYPEETIQIMKKYNSRYIFVSYEDRVKSPVIFQIAGKPISGDNTLFSILNQDEIEGFRNAYSDGVVTIYQLES